MWFASARQVIGWGDRVFATVRWLVRKDYLQNDL